MEKFGDDPSKNSKYIALKSKDKFVKELQAVESKEDTPEEDLAKDSNEDEMTFLTKRVQYLNKNKRFSRRNIGARGSNFKDKKDEAKV